MLLYDLPRSKRLRLLCLLALVLLGALSPGSHATARGAGATLHSSPDTRAAVLAAPPSSSSLSLPSPKAFASSVAADDPARWVCFPYDRIYPLAIGAHQLASLAPDTQLVVDLDDGYPQDHALLAWTVVTTTRAFESSWRGAGNLAAGFEEDAYQVMVGPSDQLNGLLEHRDWLRARSPFVVNTSNLRDSFDDLISNMTVLRLPVYEVWSGDQRSSAHQLNRLAHFAMTNAELRFGGHVYFEKNGVTYLYRSPAIVLAYLGESDEAGACPNSLAGRLLDDRTSQPLAGLSGTLSVYGDTLPLAQASLIEQAPFTTDASGAYTVTLSSSLSGTVRLGFSGLDGYFDQYADAALSPEEASTVTLHPSLNRRDVTLLARTTVAGTLLDERSDQPISNTVGTLSVYSGTQMLETLPLTTDALGSYTATLTLPLSQSVALAHDAIPGYPAQYVDRAFSRAAASPIVLHSGRNELVIRLRRHTFMPLVPA